MLGIRYSGQNTIGFGGEIYRYANFPSLAQRLRILDMSEPLSDYNKVASTSIYARDFAEGKVLVNPTNAPHIVDWMRVIKHLMVTQFQVR